MQIGWWQQLGTYTQNGRVHKKEGAAISVQPRTFEDSQEAPREYPCTPGLAKLIIFNTTDSDVNDDCSLICFIVALYVYYYWQSYINLNNGTTMDTENLRVKGKAKERRW